MFIIFLQYQGFSIVDRTYYNILKVPIHATEQQIRSSFRKISQSLHPDRNKKSSQYSKVNRAYQVLNNRQKRSRYDRYGPQFQNIQPKQQHNFFFHQQQQQQIQPNPIQLQLPISIKQAYTGEIFTLQFDGVKACHHCNGLGTEKPQDYYRCPHCNGQGISNKRIQRGNMVQIYQQQCGHCRGRGIIKKSRCKICNGNILIKQSNKFDINIQPGIKTGHQIILPNAGTQSLDGGCADIILKNWKRQNDDLQLSLNISLKQAILGFQKELTHFDGHKFTIKNKGLTTLGQRMVINNQGMPITQGRKGRLFVVIGIQIEDFNNNQLDQWQQLFSKKR